MRPAVLLGSVATILVFGLVALQTRLNELPATENTESLALVRETLTGVTHGAASSIVLATVLVFFAILFAVTAKAAS